MDTKFDYSSGALKPGATYVYERADGVVYAREQGAPASSRQVVGYDVDVQERFNTLTEIELWKNIRREAKTDTELKELLDRAEVYYRLKYGADS